MHKFLQSKYFKAIGIFFSLAIAIVPALFAQDFAELGNVGLVGFFIANYLGLGIYVLPLVINLYSPVVLVVVGAAGNTLDEYFAWLAGRLSSDFDQENKTHKRIANFMEKYGLKGLFILAVLPMPGFVYYVANFFLGHHKFKYLHVFLAGFLGKLLRWVIVLGAVLSVFEKWIL